MHLDCLGMISVSRLYDCCLANGGWQLHAHLLQVVVYRFTTSSGLNIPVYGKAFWLDYA